MWQSYVNGLLVAAGLIMAIGTQNAFVLAQSLRREHHLPVAALCVACDALLVAAGVFGLATVPAQNPTLLAVARWGGAVFLIWYGSQALRRACSKQSLQQGENQTVRSLRAVMLSALAVSVRSGFRLVAGFVSSRPGAMPGCRTKSETPHLPNGQPPAASGFAPAPSPDRRPRRRPIMHRRPRRVRQPAGDVRGADFGPAQTHSGCRSP